MVIVLGERHETVRLKNHIAKRGRITLPPHQHLLVDSPYIDLTMRARFNEPSTGFPIWVMHCPTTTPIVKTSKFMTWVILQLVKHQISDTTTHWSIFAYSVLGAYVSSPKLDPFSCILKFKDTLRYGLWCKCLRNQVTEIYIETNCDV